MSASLVDEAVHEREPHDISPELFSNPLISQVEIIGIREGGLIDCWVPTELIDHEEVPVKEEWVTSLATDMKRSAEDDGGSGQLTPIVLGLIEGEPALKIIDGFHRDAALVQNGEKRIYATIKQTDWDGLFDTRIFTAKDHAHVRFSRVVQWIREVWTYSGLDDKLTVEQAVLLYRFDSSGVKLGLSTEDADTAKTWVARKEQQWQTPAMTIHSHLRIAENVDPRLVHSTREKKGGDKLEAPTQAILKIFSEELPNKFGFQGVVMDAAMAHNLKGPQVKALCLGIRGFKNLKSAKAFIENIDWETWQPEYGESKSRALRRAHDPRHKGKAVLRDIEQHVQRITERVDLSLSRGEEVTSEMSERLQATRNGIAHIIENLGALSIKLDSLAEEEIALEPALTTETRVHNQETHEGWGLRLKSYDDEVSPAVYVDNKGQFDLDEVAAGVLLVAAQQEPGKTGDVASIKAKLAEMGFDTETDATDKAIRIAIRTIDERLQKLGKGGHVIKHSGGVRVVRFGLIA